MLGTFLIAYLSVFNVILSEFYSILCFLFILHVYLISLFFEFLAVKLFKSRLQLIFYFELLYEHSFALNSFNFDNKGGAKKLLEDFFVRLCIKVDSCYTRL